MRSNDAVKFNHAFAARCLLSVLLGVHACLLAYLSWTTSINRTEKGHLGAAVYLYKTFQFDVFHVNPPLTRFLIGLPVILSSPNLDWQYYSSRPQDRSEWGIGASFIRVNSPEKLRWIIFLARCSLIPIILLGGYFGYRFARELYGSVSGFLFLLLWVFSPLVLGWGATICPDVPAAALGIVAVYFFWQWLKNPSWKLTVVFGIFLGLLPLTKITWIIAFPLWFLCWGLWIALSYKNKKRELSNSGVKQMLTILFLGIYMINMGYCFDGTCRLLKNYTFISNTFSGTTDSDASNRPLSNNRFEKTWGGYIPVPLPAEFVQGIDTQKRDFEKGIESYLNGVYSNYGWWYYYIYILLLKEPVGIFGLLLLFFCSIYINRRHPISRDEIILILLFLTIFIVVSSQTGFSLHSRYIIPALPFLYILLSKSGQLFSKKHKILSVATTICLTWVIASSMYYYPHSMSYFNELIGGAKNGHKYLLGSNIDWGQNSYFLEEWCVNHPEARSIQIVYNSMSRLGLENAQNPTGSHVSGWIAIGVNELYDSSGQYEWLQQVPPIDCIGYSIYIYHLTDIDPEI